ncbi:MAG: hypothetical protein AUH14_05995, partial [Candidatus Rokubacteria bacterium 13_2_20CM_69_15_1]
RGDAVERKRSVVTPERFARGMTFDAYVAYVGTPDNLKREGSQGEARRDWSGYLRRAYEAARLTDAQAASVAWLTAQPNGPAKVLVISEEWSSDCRRDLPILARLAEAGGMELRIFRRDGARFSRSQTPSLAEAPDSNADLMAEFMNRKNGQAWQSIPVVVFYTKALEYLCHYIEPGETPEETQKRGTRLFFELLDSPFFRVWQCAAVDEMLSMLHERLVVGSLA